MENGKCDQKPRCGQLERLAAAAATLDYTDSHSPMQPQSSSTSDNESSRVSLHSHLQPPHTHIQASHAVSFMDAYQIPKTHQLIPVRSLDGHSNVQNQDQVTQPLPTSRVLMVTSNCLHQPNDTQFAKHAQYGPNDLSYHSHNLVNNMHTTYSETITPSSPHVAHFGENSAEMGPPLFVDQFGEASARYAAEGKGSLEMVPKHAINLQSKRTISERGENDDDDDEWREDSGKNGYSCENCKKTFDSEEECKRHHRAEHNVPKRNVLPLELKVEIIKRIQSGERKADIGEEFGVNTSTIKSLMKKADTYLASWNKGMFNPDSKRLKGPKRVDIEEALFSWYKEAIGQQAPVSGPILCAKAQDFAKKLGHTDFKPTHGWLDRFKKRKKIVLGRGGSKRRKEDKTQDFFSSVLPQLLMDHEATDIFALELLGLYYHSLPSDVERLKGNKCAGGINSKERMSVVLCTNMVGSEKFPLLVVGRHHKGKIKNSKSVLVHYVVDRYAWLTSEIMSSWLLDMDSWCVQQDRKIILLAPPSPLYSNHPKLRAIKLVCLPQGYPAPLRQVATPYFKKLYRKKLLEELMKASSREDSVRAQLSTEECLQILLIAWQCLSDNLIATSFQRSGITKYGVLGIGFPQENSNFVNIQELFMNAIHTLEENPPSGVTFEDFVHFDDDIQVCNLMGDDDILAKVKGITEQEDSEAEEENKENDVDRKLTRVSFLEVEGAINILKKYIQYQEGAQEMIRVLTHLEYFIYRNVPESQSGNQIVH